MVTIEEQLAKAERERDSFKRQLAMLQDAILLALVQRIEPRMSRHPVTVVQHAGSVIARIGEAIDCQFEDGDDLVAAVGELVRERDEARSTIDDLTDEIDRGRVAIRLWRADMSDTHAVLERIAAAVGVEVVALAEDASIAIHRSALESCNRAQAAAEAECTALRRELARIMDDH